ncbi:crossover junction endodeoxyribonuclease RuvC [Glaciihabitans sp. GrIS 2.15]|nr:crossover junction endodeoxyribonuclease RuvC [Glaciihabitans sp. GrIS 2.15]
MVAPRGATIRVLGIDPGLTRCGVGIVDVTATRTATLVDVVVIRSGAELPLEQRLLLVGNEIERLLDLHQPHAVAIERVFAQQNLTTVMGVAQISGVALHLAAKRGLVVGLHTPSEVKSAITGYGSADKKQVATMVAKVLGLAEVPKPADASDALAIAICHAWKRGAAVASPGGSLTKAQETWLAAERSAAKSPPKRRLGS